MNHISVLHYLALLILTRSEPQIKISSLIKRKEQGLNLREHINCGNLPILTEYDFVVVGASPAGCVVANKLTSNPNITVLILESGLEENIYTDIPAIAPFLPLTGYNWKYTAAYRKGLCRAMEHKTCTWPSGKAIGGGSVINRMIYTRGNPRDYDKWAEAGNSGWDYKSLVKYFKEVEDMRINDLRDEPCHGTRGSVTISYPNFKSEVADKFILAGLQRGYEKVDYNRPDTQTGFSRIQSAIQHGKRCSASKAFLLPVRDRSNLHISQCSHATKIVLDEYKSKAVGVEFIKKSQKRYVKVKREVILSAGAFNSPQLLMLSGIGPAEHLKEFGIPVIEDLPVGNNLQEHMGTNSITFTIEQFYPPEDNDETYSLPRKIAEWEHASGNLSSTSYESIAYVKSTFADDSPDIELIQIEADCNANRRKILRKKFAIRDDIYNAVFKELEGKPTFSILVMGMYPLSKGTVKLKSKNPCVQPYIDGNFLDAKQDLDVVIQGIRKAIELSETPAMQELGTRLHKKPLPSCKNFTFDSDPYWECFIRHFTFQYYDQCGTCKMGPATNPTAVVDQRLRVHRINGLRVVDASIFPSIPGGHILAPSYVVGAKAADLIKEEYYPESTRKKSHKKKKKKKKGQQNQKTRGQDKKTLFKNLQNSKYSECEGS